jgi:hypothetical protein
MRVIFQRHPPGGVACREGKTIQAISWTENRQVILFFSSCLRLCCCRYCYSRSLLLTSHFPSDPEDFDHISLGQLLRWRDLIATPHPREHGKQPDVAFFFFFFSLRVPLACCFSWLYFRLSRRLFLWHLFLSPAERVPPFPAFGIGLDSLIAIVHPRRITLRTSSTSDPLSSDNGDMTVMLHATRPTVNKCQIFYAPWPICYISPLYYVYQLERRMTIRIGDDLCLVLFYLTSNVTYNIPGHLMSLIFDCSSSL